MDFGRVKDFAEVDYTLPPDHAGLEKVLGGNPPKKPLVFVGGVLWSDESFVGTIYPQSAKPKDFAKYYCRQFNTVELNLTHYRMPEAAGLQRWRELAPDGFRFCPKVHQSISHAVDLRSMLGYHNACAASFKLLGDKLGMCFLQLPPAFGPAWLSNLLEFIDGSDLRELAIEVRHPDWFAGTPALNGLCNYLYKNNMPLVITDTPGRRDVLHMRLTCKTAFIRFNAHNNHPSDKNRMDAWVLRLKYWFEKGLESVYFFVHTPQQAHMPHLVTYFIQQLKKHCGIELQTPRIATAENKQNSLF